jgi:outer membrane protein assembly factor BamE (lipoprotein component of BamABCDE complex)
VLRRIVVVMSRNRRVACVIAVLLAPVAVLTGCAGSHKANEVFAVKTGMTKQQVLKLAGSPYHSGPNCWLYHASKQGTTIDGMRFCFADGRVSLIQTSAHL